MKKPTFFSFFWRKTALFLSVLEICLGLIMAHYPALAQEYLYPRSVLLGGEIGLIQMGWIHVGIGFWSGWCLYEYSHDESNLLFTLRSIWSVLLFKDLWSLLYLVSWQHGWGSMWHGLHLGVCLLMWSGLVGFKK